jgi:hypothetical protein
VKAAFTSATISYMPRAFSLAKSFLQHNHDYRFFIFIIDNDKQIDFFQSAEIDLITIGKTGIKNFEQLTDRLSISEISFTLKPILSLYLIEHYPDLEIAFYFDADIMVYHRLDEAERLLKIHDFVLTPHFLHPIEDASLPTELDILRTGLYNMGFAGFRNCDNAKNILTWWKRRVLQFGFENRDLGLSADQMWMSLAPLFFEKVGIIKHPGYNFAYWNVHERTLTKNGNQIMVNTDYPLVFIHFADFNPEKPEQFTNPQHFNRHIAKGKEILDELCLAYAKTLTENHYHRFAGVKSKYQVSPLQQAWKNLCNATANRERLKYFAILLFGFLPARARNILRKFSLFIIRNIK